MCAVFIAFHIIHPQFGQQTFVGKTCFERILTKHGWFCRITIFELPPGKDHEPVRLTLEATLCQSTFDGLGFLGRNESNFTWTTSFHRWKIPLQLRANFVVMSFLTDFLFSRLVVWWGNHPIVLTLVQVQVNKMLEFTCLCDRIIQLDLLFIQQCLDEICFVRWKSPINKDVRSHWPGGHPCTHRIIIDVIFTVQTTIPSSYSDYAFGGCCIGICTYICTALILGQPELRVWGRRAWVQYKTEMHTLILEEIQHVLHVVALFVLKKTKTPLFIPLVIPLKEPHEASVNTSPSSLHQPFLIYFCNIADVLSLVLSLIILNF